MAATKFDIYKTAARFLADARFSLITDDTETRYAFDDAWPRAAAFVLRQAAWTHALKAASLTSNGSTAPGFANGYGYPADWVRTVAIYRHSTDGRESPIDLREQGINILTNSSTAPVMRYVSSDYLDPELASHPWPEHFSELVAVYLAFLAGERVTGDSGAPARMSEIFASLLPEAMRLDAMPESPWLRHQRSGAFLRAAREVLRQGFWRHAMATAAATAGGTPATGYANAFTKPADWLATHRLYVASAGREYAFDVREHGTTWSANRTAFSVRYVSTAGLDATLWPEPFMAAVLALLDHGATGDEKSPPSYPALLAAALASDSDPPDPFLARQLDGSFLRASREVMGRGFWRFGLKERQIDASMQSSGTPQFGFPYLYALPADHLRTHALFVPWDGRECPINIRESETGWSTNAGGSDPPPPPGAVGAFVARYLSTDVLDASGGGDATKAWPELVSRAVLAYLDWQEAPAGERKLRQGEFDRLMVEALTAHARPQDDWLRFQLDGSYQRAVLMLLEKGRWRFAVRTADLTPSSDDLPGEWSDGAASSSYGYRFIQPTDLLRTLHLYYLIGSGTNADRVDIDYRDEAGAYHTNYTPVTVRYVSRLGLDSTRWPENFRRAAHACVLHLEAPDDARRLALYEEAAGRAEGLDDARDMPRTRSPGRLVRARWGASAGDRENGRVLT